MRRLPRRVWLIIALALFVGCFVWARAATQGGGDREAADLSTYNSKKAGLRALYLTLEQLHYPVTRARRSFAAGLPPQQGVLIIAQPLLPIEPKELTALTRWVGQGHTLLLVADSGFVAMLQANPLLGSAADIPTTDARPAQPTYLAHGVGRVAAKFGSDLEIPDAPASSRRAGPPESDETGLPLPKEITRGVPIFHAGARPVVTYQRLGRGAVILLRSTWTVSNQGISHAGNLNLVLNALGPASATRPIWFDEYHHGYGVGPAVSRLLTPRQRRLIDLALLQLGLGLLLVMYARSRRLGRIIPLLSESRQRSEFLGTMSTVLRRGEATPLALRTARDALADRLRRQFGLPPEADAAALAEAAARVNPEAAEKLKEALGRCDTALASGHKPTPHTALTLVRSLDEAEKELGKL